MAATPRPENRKRDQRSAIFGYDTRSLRSAVVMRAVDCLRPFRRPEAFEWRSPCVVSSIAGLGDLFIHLPLIAGIVAKCRDEGVDVRVALRPAHAALGEQCGWNVLPFDNALEDFFKNRNAIHARTLFARARETRRSAPRLWIDLTGNAVSALAIKAAGARKLAARTTRGGRSLVDHPLPHLVQENEYSNRERVAAYLGCALDYTVSEQLFGEPLPALSGACILCVTTAARWKNWPLQNYRRLVEMFPQTRFAVVGLRREVLPEETSALNAILARPNVTDCLDTLSVPELVRLVAHSSAVITNDTSAAHIANLFGKPGAVLFGPVNAGTFASATGLRIFSDQTCPLHPCVQWRCDNEANWCMRKITPEEIAAHLAAIALK